MKAGMLRLVKPAIDDVEQLMFRDVECTLNDPRTSRSSNIFSTLTWPPFYYLTAFIPLVRGDVAPPESRRSGCGRFMQDNAFVRAKKSFLVYK